MNYLNSTIKWVKHKYYNVFVNMKFNLIIYNTIFFFFMYTCLKIYLYLVWIV